MFQTQGQGKKQQGDTNWSTELSLTVPITNSLAFLFTVLGDWYVERKVISKGTHSFTPSTSKRHTDLIVETWLGMALSLSGIALCVQSKR